MDIKVKKHGVTTVHACGEAKWEKTLPEEQEHRKCLKWREETECQQKLACQVHSNYKVMLEEFETSGTWGAISAVKNQNLVQLQTKLTLTLTAQA